MLTVIVYQVFCLRSNKEAELLELQLRVEAALCGLGPVTSGPMWLDPVTGDLVLLVEIDLPNI